MALWRALDYTKLNADIAEIIFDLGFDWRKRGIRSATLFLFACYRSTPLILLSFLLFHCRYHAGVANNRFIGCLVGLLLLLYMASLQADFQPVRIPFRQRQNKTNRQKFACSFCLAEARGFEPLSPWRLHDFQSCPLWPLRYASILRFYFKALPRLLSAAFLFYMFSL